MYLPDKPIHYHSGGREAAYFERAQFMKRNIFDIAIWGGKKKKEYLHFLCTHTQMPMTDLPKEKVPNLARGKYVHLSCFQKYTDMNKCNFSTEVSVETGNDTGSENTCPHRHKWEWESKVFLKAAFCSKKHFYSQRTILNIKVRFKLKLRPQIHVPAST